MSLREREKIQEVLRGLKSAPGNQNPAAPVRIAGIQFSASGEIETNIKRAVEFARVALEKKADVIAFSELFCLPWFDSDDPQYPEHAESVPGPTTEPFIDLAKQYHAVILCPVFERDRDRTYNTTVIISGDGSIEKYRKVHIPNIPFWEETRYFQPGDLGFPVFQTSHARIGIQMGWDNFFPEGSRILALKGAHLIIAPTAAAFDSQFRWQSVMSANAVVNGVFVFRINRVGKEKDLNFYGKSFCVDPFGEMTAEPAFHRDAIVIADIDIADTLKARTEFPFLMDRKPALYQDLIGDPG
ncbi:acyltransferase [bacterium]|nr:acyltransferase [candidate division CSSED10-310 bacterium]